MKIWHYLAQISRNYNNKLWWKRHLMLRLSRLLYRKNTGALITEEDWDHLIILDACRFDTFKEEIQNTSLIKKGTLEYRISRGSMTREFLLENFGSEHFKDIIYVTANPFVDMLLKGRFYRIIPVWKDGWDEELKTIHPKTVYEYALKAIGRYPGKRFIIHFMQPHFPYLTVKIANETGFSKHREAALKGKSKWKDVTVWDLVEMGEVNIEDVKRGYRESLRIALEYVEKLVEVLDGKIVITADHGEAFGEYFHPLIPLKVYGHPQGVRIPALVKVPWFVVDKPKKSMLDEEKLKLSKAISRAIEKGNINM